MLLIIVKHIVIQEFMLQWDVSELEVFSVEIHIMGLP